MKALCTTTCQKDRKKVYEAGKEYDVTEDMLKSGFFRAVQPEKPDKREDD